MELEKELLVYGSYEKSLHQTEVIVGHQNVVYMVGGNAHYNVRSNVIDWRLSQAENAANLVGQINSILNLSTYVDDELILSNLLDELAELNFTDLIKFLEKSLRLNEAVCIQLRRLFYIIQNIANHGKVEQEPEIKFCPYEPVTRINRLLEQANIMINSQDYDNIITLIEEANELIHKKREITTDQPNPYKTGQDQDILEKISNFIKIYGEIYPALEETEKLNIQIAKKLESICNILEKNIV